MLPETFLSDLDKPVAASPRRQAARGDVILEYQPIIALGSGAVRGLSAVSRRPPSRQASEVGPWALAQACVEARYWPSCRMAVSVSPEEIEAGRLLDHVDAALAMSGLAAGLLDVELAGAGQSGLSSSGLNVLFELRERGVGVVLDRFGLGRAVLLRHLPLTAVKLDRCLVSAVPLDAKACDAACRLLYAAHRVGLKVIADSVATLAQREFLVRIGCDEAQGTLYSRPLPPHRLAVLLDYGVDTCSKPRSPSETRHDRAV